MGGSLNLPRILIQSSSAFTLGGMERVMQTLGRMLPRYGFSTEVMIPSGPLAEERHKWFLDHGVTVSLSDELFTVAQQGMRAVPGLVRVLKRKEAAVVNVHSPGHHIPIAELIAARLVG